MFFESFARSQRSRHASSIGMWNWKRAVRKKFRILQECGLESGACLEIGPGEGDFARLCAEHGIDYKGIERSPTYQQKLAAEGFAVELGTAPPLRFENDKFHAVLILTVLEHMPTYEQALALLSESCRVLKRNGLLAIEVPDFMRCGIDFYAWDYTHSFLTTQRRLNQVLCDAGFAPQRWLYVTGSLSSPVIRWPIDLVGFFIHSRFFYWLAISLGAEKLLEKYRKTLEPAIYVVSRKIAA
jgi:SAM-dependent methyltransferase